MTETREPVSSLRELSKIRCSSLSCNSGQNHPVVSDGFPPAIFLDMNPSHLTPFSWKTSLEQLEAGKP